MSTCTTSGAASVANTHAVVTTANSGVNTIVTASQSQSGGDVQAMELQIARLEAEQAQLQKAQREKELQERIRALQAENSALRASIVGTPTSAAVDIPSTSAGPVIQGPAPISNMTVTAPTGLPSLANFGQMAELNDQVNHHIHGNATAAAIATPAPAPSTTAATRGTPITSTSATASAQGKKLKVLSPENFARRPGLAELTYNRLSVQEFVIGALRIQHSPSEVSDSERRACTSSWK